MDKRRWQSRLQALGLSTYEARVYLALLGENDAPVSRIVRKSGVPQAKVYGVLQSLVSRGYAQSVLGEIQRYRGVPPTAAFEAHSRAQQAALDEARGVMEELEREAPDAPSEDPASLGLRLVRGEHVGAAYVSLLESAQREVFTSAKAPLVVAPARSEEGSLHRRGVVARHLVEKAVMDDEPTARALRALAREFKNMRSADELPLRFAVFDGHTVMLELAEEDGSPMGLIVPNRGFAQNMRRMFLALWQGAKGV